MDGISEDHDLLRRGMFKEPAKHPALARIDTWERESSSRIREVAELARTELRTLLDRTKTDLKMSIESMTDELDRRRQSDDFTENDLKRWMEQLNELRKKLDYASVITTTNDDENQSCIRLIRISDRSQTRPCAPPIRLAEHTKESVAFANERFGDVDGKAVLADDGRLVTCCLASILTQPIIYGLQRYSAGKHHLRFRVEKIGDARLFCGIVRSLENISRSGQAQNSNTSLYGWWDLNEAIVNGKVQTSKYRNLIGKGDEVVLTLDCDNKQIQLQHQRTKRLARLTVELDKCPLPWKVVLRLQSVGDSVRILS